MKFHIALDLEQAFRSGQIFIVAPMMRGAEVGYVAAPVTREFMAGAPAGVVLEVVDSAIRDFGGQPE